MSVEHITRHLNETSGTLKNKNKLRNREKGAKNIGTDISEIGVPTAPPLISNKCYNKLM